MIISVADMAVATKILNEAMQEHFAKNPNKTVTSSKNTTTASINNRKPLAQIQSVDDFLAEEVEEYMKAKPESEPEAESDEDRPNISSH